MGWRPARKLRFKNSHLGQITTRYTRTREINKSRRPAYLDAIHSTTSRHLTESAGKAAAGPIILDTAK